MGSSVSVVVVSYNTRDLLRQCLQSVFASVHRPAEVFVVDNASADGSTLMVAAEFPVVTLVALDRNLGFGAANNVALRRCRSPYVLLLNPDAVLAPDALGALVAALDARPGAGVVGPRILNPDGSLQSSGYHFPTLLTELRTSKRVDAAITALSGPAAPLPHPTDVTDVDWCDGACMLVRQAAIEQVGGFDEQYFLYTEELDWCFNARKAGWSIVVEPRAVVWHHRGQSSVATNGVSVSISLLVETKLRYYRKNHSMLTAMAAAAVMGAGFVKTRRRDPAARAKLEGIARWWRSVGQAPAGRAGSSAGPA
jgi:N-acetylglucosaminyl-diphospho-decaprenol L-rhamnosyltransferase